MGKIPKQAINQLGMYLYVNNPQICKNVHKNYVHFY